MIFAMPPQRYVTMVLNPLLVGVGAIFLVLSANDLIKLPSGGQRGLCAASFDAKNIAAAEY